MNNEGLNIIILQEKEGKNESVKTISMTNKQHFEWVCVVHIGFITIFLFTTCCVPFSWPLRLRFQHNPGWISKGKMCYKNVIMLPGTPRSNADGER